MAQRSDLVRRIRREAPRLPGVYLFFGEREALLYVRKSLNLRSRMLSYFSAPPGALARRIEDMVRMTWDFRYLTTHTELQALLLEDLLIKHERPPVNVRQTKSAPGSYLVVSGEAFDTLRVTTKPAPSGGDRCFGPFRNRWQAARLRDALADHLRLPACEGTASSRGCYRRELGTCPGPCRGTKTAAYRGGVEQAIAFLNGDDGPFVLALQAQQARQAQSLAFEKAAARPDAPSTWPRKLLLPAARQCLPGRALV
ncbi:MAG: hypothetical protein HY814_05070 [Candidatus Riflebacteria bacterium]|nr:hypothetical protein [Candidatus Riflebacteria bacterium]